MFQWLKLSSAHDTSRTKEEDDVGKKVKYIILGRVFDYTLMILHWKISKVTSKVRKSSNKVGQLASILTIILYKNQQKYAF